MSLFPVLSPSRPSRPALSSAIHDRTISTGAALRGQQQSFWHTKRQARVSECAAQRDTDRSVLLCARQGRLSPLVGDILGPLERQMDWSCGCFCLGWRDLGWTRVRVCRDRFAFSSPPAYCWPLFCAVVRDTIQRWAHGIHSFQRGTGPASRMHPCSVVVTSTPLPRRMQVATRVYIPDSVFALGQSSPVS